jgi:ubiquinone/menaquinone biosynthesis C-methylase UbiE
MSEPCFDDSQAYFAAVAESYDRLQPVVAGPSYSAGLGFVLDLVPHQPDDEFTAVELGCGTATLSCSVLDRFPRAAVIAIDGEPAMLKVAESKLAGYRERAEVRQEDVLACEVPDCRVALSSFMFHHVPPQELDPFLRRIGQALTPGGCLIVLDTMQVGTRSGKRVGAQSRRVYRRHVAAAIEAGRATQEEIDARWEFKRRMKAAGKDVEHFHSADAILDAMSTAGFEEAGLQHDSPRLRRPREWIAGPVSRAAACRP